MALTVIYCGVEGCTHVHSAANNLGLTASGCGHGEHTGEIRVEYPNADVPIEHDSPEFLPYVEANFPKPV